jgi:hypothetical protein
LALRVNAVHDCLDDVKDFGDHFTASLPTPVGHPLGEEKEICKNFTIPSTKEKTP